MATLTGVGSGPYQYQEDSKGRLYQLVNPLSQTTKLHYDLDGKNLEVDFPNGAKELRAYYAPQDWLQTITIQSAGSSTYDRWSYSYPDGTGHLGQETDLGNRVHSFGYNHRYELNGESDPYLGTVAYGYDLNGNRTSRTDGNGTDYYGVDANNKLMWVNHGTNAPPTSGQAGAYMLFNYDLNGNMTHRERRFLDGTFLSFDLYWDGADNLRTIYQSGVQNWIAAYNGDGLRVRLFDTAGGSFPTEHDFTWGLGGVLYDTFNSTTYTPGVAQHVNGTDRFFHTDWLGSTRYLSDSTGNSFPSALRYDAFGNRSAYGGTYDPTPFQFAGDWGYQSEFATGPEAGTGLQYLRSRYFDPAIGRFVSPDPLSFLGGPNLYEYADNDPVTNLDPSGLLWKELFGGLGIIVGGAAGAPEGGIGAVPGAAIGGGIGAFIGSRLDGLSIKRAAVNGVVAGGSVYIGGRLSELGEAAPGLRASSAAARAGDALRLVVGGGRAPGFPALGECDVSLNIDPGALPDVLGRFGTGGRGAASIPFRNGSFTEVFLERLQFTAFTGRRVGALAEAARILRPGGRLIIETGRLAPADEIRAALERLGFQNIQVARGDLLRVTATLRR